MRTSRDAWFAVSSIAAATFVAVTTEFLPVGLLGTIASDVGVSDGTAGALVAVPAFAAVAAAPVVLVGSGTVDRRRIMVGLTALLFVANVLSMVAPSFALLLLARVAFGAAVGALWSVGPSLGVRLVAPGDVPRATALIITGVSLGTVLGVPVGTVLGDLVGWRAAFGATAAVAAVVLLAQLRWIPSRPAARALRMTDFTSVARRPAVVLTLAVTALFVTGHFAAYTFVEPFLRDEAHASPTVVSGILLAFGAAGLAANAISSWSAPRWPLVTFSAVVGSVLVGAGLLPVIGTSAPIAALLVLVWGAGFGAWATVANLRAFAAAPEALEVIGGLMVVGSQSAVAAGSLVGGLATDAAGPSAAMVGGAALSAAALALVLATRNAAPLVP